MMENHWVPQVGTCSALENNGVKEIYEIIRSFDEKMSMNGWKIQNRKKQNIYWLHLAIKEELGNKKYKAYTANGKLKLLEKELTKGKTIYQLLSKL